MQIVRLIVAFLVAPFAGPIIGLVVGSNAPTISYSLIFLYWFTYTSIGILRYFAWIPALVISIPVYLLMRRKGWLGWWQLVLMWGVAQALPAVAAAFILPDSSVFILTSFVEGALGGAVFWIIAGPMNLSHPITEQTTEQIR
jgi:ABC-type tungstate transport system substrate-binding protein